MFLFLFNFVLQLTEVGTMNLFIFWENENGGKWNNVIDTLVYLSSSYIKVFHLNGQIMYITDNHKKCISQIIFENF